MNKKSAACVVAALALALAACGGEQPAPTQPTNPAPSASAAPEGGTASEAPSASAAPVASSAVPAPSAEASAAAPPPAPGPGEWDKWSKDQKREYMKTAVMPKMGALFHDFDSTKYATPKCGLCHGSGVKDGTFKMPSADLPKLPATPADFKKLQEKSPKVFNFMVHDVEQQQAALLGEQPYDIKTKQGFGCFNCHTKK